MRLSTISQIILAAVLLGIAALNLRTVLVYSPIVKMDLIMDEAGVLNETESAYIVDYHNALLDDYGIDYRVLTTYEAADMDRLAAARLAKLDGGRFNESSQNLLLVVHPGDDAVRLKVGSALGDLYTPAFVEFVEKTQMLPFFREHREGAGIVATSELIISRAQEADKTLGYDFSDTGESLTEDTTAVSPSPIPETGEPAETGVAPLPDIHSTGDPLETVNAYIQAMDSGNTRPDLDIYSTSTREMLKDWVVTKAQMRNVVRENRRCSGAEARTLGKKGVVRYELEPAVCNPYFLIREGGRWRIDFVTMQQLIRFDENGHWSLPWGAGDFSFAFPDLPITSPPVDKCRWCFTFRSEELTILSVDPGSVGEQMGLEIGDRILELDGKRDPSMQWVFSHLYTVERGAMVKITVLREGRRLRFSHPAP